MKVIAVEVITPAGNWSSYLPHKHEEHRAGVETRLEEIYYFETAITRDAGRQTRADPIALFSAYGLPAGEFAISEIVRTGDDGFYLNVMAGPDVERDWLIVADPAHAWLRDT